METLSQGRLARPDLPSCDETDAELGLGEHVLEEDRDFGIRGSEAPDGRSVLPMFTSEKRLVEWIPTGSHWIGLSGRDALHMFVRGAWDVVLIDAGSRDAREVSRSEAQRLLDSE